MSQYVYFIHDIVQRKIKIGLSDSPERRLSQLCKPSGLRLICVLPGTRELERDIHNMFARYRTAGPKQGGGSTEWFSYSKAIAAFAKSHTLPLPITDRPSVYPLVLPPSLHRRIKVAAVENGVTTHQAIVSAIAQVYGVPA